MLKLIDTKQLEY